MKSKLFIALLVLASHSAFSADNMTFHGTLVYPPCKVNDGATIEVPFGNDLGVNKINGINYLKRVDYKVTCDIGYFLNNLAIELETTSPAAFDNSSINTTSPGLALKIFVNGRAANFSVPIPIEDTDTLPLIQVVPVKDPAVNLVEGAFEATMTLRTDYL